MIEAGGDGHAVGVFVEDEAVQRTPPTRNSATQIARAIRTRAEAIRIAMAIRKGLRGFMI